MGLDGFDMPQTDEFRVKDPDTGGEKGTKLCRMDLIPAGPLMELGNHYGVGSRKYQDRNWEKGYKWSLSFAAAMRHAWQFWNGEDRDPETGSKHVIAAAWHMLALAEFMETHKEKDDRPRVPCPSVENFLHIYQDRLSEGVKAVVKEEVLGI